MPGEFLKKEQRAEFQGAFFFFFAFLFQLLQHSGQSGLCLCVTADQSVPAGGLNLFEKYIWARSVLDSF